MKAFSLRRRMHSRTPSLLPEDDGSDAGAASFTDAFKTRLRMPLLSAIGAIEKQVIKRWCTGWNNVVKKKGLGNQNDHGDGDEDGHYGDGDVWHVGDDDDDDGSHCNAKWRHFSSQRARWNHYESGQEPPNRLQWWWDSQVLRFSSGPELRVTSLWWARSMVGHLSVQSCAFRNASLCACSAGDHCRLKCTCSSS